MPEETSAQSLASFIESISEMMDKLAASVSSIIQQIMPIVQQVYQAMNLRYQEAGAPYGDTHEGLMRWMHDMGEISRKQQEIARILQYHEMLVGARKLGEEFRRRVEQAEGVAAQDQSC